MNCEQERRKRASRKTRNSLNLAVKIKNLGNEISRRIFGLRDGDGDDGGRDEMSTSRSSKRRKI
jgi:hypothetical protein